MSLPTTSPPTLGPTASSPPTSSSSSTFDFPREYNFPPFFTKQTNLTTLHAQLEKWSSLILSYCRHHRLFRLSLSYEGSAYEDLFRNRRLNKSLRLADAREVLDFMRKEGRAEPVSGSGGGGGGISSISGMGGGKEVVGDVFWIYWRSPEEWAEVVEAWVEETGQKNTVLTLYELTEGDGTRGTEFYGLDAEILQKALQVLVKRGKAQIFGQEDQQGIKFF
ncbi:ESCRT-II complex, vps25 subunit [Annulohypoxylon maeteangense]|uniref:ESCRT-II complex, vps25 subunit n=1 Tax=Annulohypoxylon maeteangense TaxID=1927788 RepID=UPI002007CD1A|nr:ESCRT-II complex, vps25 subunit [Annulohypoxylon maeteangense]KAI0887938.1 ESCRT-II complex, vps25 subunit [Annulohypoxylon maeteangense]